MTVKLTFVLTPRQGEFHHVLSVLKRVEGLEPIMGEQDEGDIVCVCKLPDDHSERTANVCGSMCRVEGVDKVGIFVNVFVDADSKPEPVSRREHILKPLVPMIISSVVTFFLVYSAVAGLIDDWTWYQMFNFAAIPAIVTFLTQFGMVNEWWKPAYGVLEHLRRK